MGVMLRPMLPTKRLAGRDFCLRAIKDMADLANG